MPNATYQQPNFLGGEWSPFFQGRADHPKYKTAMNLSRNGLPLEEGAWTRRPGFRLLAPTRYGQDAKLYPVFFTESVPYTAEFTDSALRFFNGGFPVITEEFVGVVAISTANPAVMTLNFPTNWLAGDEVAFWFSSMTADQGQNMRQRIFKVTPVAETFSAWSSSSTYGVGSLVSYSGVNYIGIAASNLNKQPDINPTFWTALPTGSTRLYSLQDAVTGANFDGSTVSVNTFVGMYALRSLKLTTPYAAGAWETARIVQNKDIAVVLNGLHIPQALTITPNLGWTGAASASIKDVRFLDGPYFDPVHSSIASVSGVSGVVTITIAFQTYDPVATYAIGDFVTFGTSAYEALTGANSGNQPDTHPANWKAVDPGYAVTGPGNTTVGFQATDVGRLIRLFSEPAAYNSGTNYATGVTVTFNGEYYTTIQPVSNVQPDTDATKWSITPNAAIWTWAQITAVTNTYTVSAQIMGDPIPWTGVAINTWRLGVYSDTTGWPTAGTFCEGRFWFGGSQPNRFDTTIVGGGILGKAVDDNGNINMAPTDKYGTVTDAHAISYVLESEEQDPIYWFALDHLGIIAGTKGGEWLIQASQLSDPFTPTSIQAHKVTKYKAADIEPRRTGIALIFVQAFKRRIMEMIADVFSGRFSAPHLTETAKHLTQAGVAEIGYQEELAPVLWVRNLDGSLKGATYRRVSAFTTEAPAFVGWHRHDLGHGRPLKSMAVGPNQDGTLDALSVVTKDAVTNVNFVEQLTQLFDEEDNILDAFFLDGAIVPDAFVADTVGGVAGLRFTGLWYLVGKTVSGFVAGLDVGDFTVDANGTVFVPFGSGIDPGKYDYSSAGAGAWQFTQTYVNSILALARKNRNGSVNVAASETLTSTTTNPNPNGTTSKIQSLLWTTMPRDDALIMDWGTNNLIASSADQSTLYKTNVTNGVQGASEVVATMTGNVGEGWGLGTMGDTDREGNCYINGSGGNYAPLIKFADATYTLGFHYGASSSFGPPGNPGIANGGSICVAEANAPWVVSIESGVAITFNSGTNGSFIAGNLSNDPAYQGYNQSSWGLETTGGTMDAGAATHSNNVASVYLMQAGSGYPSSVAFFFIGVADGVPQYGSNTPNDGSTGKKGKGKKGAMDGGVTHTPTIDNPLTFFAKIGTLAATDIDPDFTALSGWNGTVVDWFDNSIIGAVTLSTSGFTTWTSGHVFAYDHTNYAAWDVGTTYALNAFVRGTVLTNNTAVLYKSLVAGNLGNLVTDNTKWALQGVAYLPWDVAHAYVTGDFVVGSNNSLYKASQATTGNDPTTDGGIHWTAVTTHTTLISTDGLAGDNQTRVWKTALTNVTVQPTVDATGSSFPQSGTYWKEKPTRYCFAYTTGKYSRTNSGSIGLKWAVPLNFQPTINGNIAAQGRVNGGLFGIASFLQDTAGSLTVCLIDTTTGKYFYGEIPGVTSNVTANQLWDDQTESFIFTHGASAGIQYTSTATGAPIALNSTVSFSNQWCRLYVGNLVPSTKITSTLTTQPTTKTFIFATNTGGGIPAVFGYTYTSQGQMLRAILQQDAGARNGPALGKTRRSHLFAALLYNTLGISFGTEFTTKGMIRANLKDEATGIYTPPTATFSGLWRDSLEDKYGFDSMVGWQITRPYPASVVSMEVATKTQDI